MTSAFSDWQIGRRKGELPEGWAKATLEEVVAHKIGGEWGEEPGRADEDPGYARVRVIRGTEFRGWQRDKGSTAAHRAVRRSSLAKRQLAPGDLVIEISGGGVSQPVGRALLIDAEAVERAGLPLICSNFCRQVRLHPQVVPGFVHLALLHQYRDGGFDEYQTQTTNLRNLDFPKFLAGVILPLPPAAEQERIVTRVAELAAIVERVRTRLAGVPGIVRRLRQSVLDAAYSGRLTEEWRERQGSPEPLSGSLERVFHLRHDAYARECSEAEARNRRAPRRPRNLAAAPWQAPEQLEIPESPEGWSVVSLQDLVHRVQYGTSVRADGEARTGVPVLRMSNIQDGKIDLSDLKYLRPDAEDVSAYAVRRGDILFNRTNSPELVGKAAVFDGDLRATFASYLIRLECDERLVSSRYLCGWINSPWGRAWARTVRTDCSGQSNINASKLRTMPVPVPPLAEQHEIVRRVEALFGRADAIAQRVAAVFELVEKLWRTVLDRALCGELVVTEAELARGDGRGYEPAAELLDRIRAERLATPARGARRSRKAVVRTAAGSTAEEVASDQILAAIRQSCWGAGAQSAEELIRKVAFRLGLPGFGKAVRARLETHLEMALARRIVARQGDLLVGATPTFGRYDFDFLIRTARSLLKGDDGHERSSIVQAVSVHLGYSQTTAAIQERMDRVFAWAVQHGIFKVEGGKIRRSD